MHPRSTRDAARLAIYVGQETWAALRVSQRSIKPGQEAGLARETHRDECRKTPRKSQSGFFVEGFAF